mmetsp:Transcript_3635/g.13323  ORF Transcript_3635/g.13323 Transcript_3635/m.13323 type:complete len:237 (-) Transcript_3635:171-881(-)
MRQLGLALGLLICIQEHGLLVCIREPRLDVDDDGLTCAMRWKPPGRIVVTKNLSPKGEDDLSGIFLRAPAPSQHELPKNVAGLKLPATLAHGKGAICNYLENNKLGRSARLVAHAVRGLQLYLDDELGSALGLDLFGEHDAVQVGNLDLALHGERRAALSLHLRAVAGGVAEHEHGRTPRAHDGLELQVSGGDVRAVENDVALFVTADPHTIGPPDGQAEAPPNVLASAVVKKAQR